MLESNIPRQDFYVDGAEEMLRKSMKNPKTTDYLDVCFDRELVAHGPSLREAFSDKGVGEMCRM